MMYILLFREKQELNKSKNISQVDAGGREGTEAEETVECG